MGLSLKDLQRIYGGEIKSDNGANYLQNKNGKFFENGYAQDANGKDTRWDKKTGHFIDYVDPNRYSSKPHELRFAYVTGNENNRVGWVNIPVKGYIAIDSEGNAYNYNENTNTPVKQKLTNYDKEQIRKAVNQNGGLTSSSTSSANIVANAWKTNLPWTNLAKQKLNVQMQQKDNKTTTDIDKGKDVNKPGADKTKTGKPTNGTPPVANNGFQKAFDAARSAGQGTFTFNGKLYSTLQKGENLNDYRRAHSDLDNYYNNLANGDSLGGWKQPSKDKMKSLMTFNLRDVDTTRTTPADLIETKPVSTPATPTALASFTNNDIRNLGFNNYNGLVSAVNNKANANNPFVKSLTARYGSDTSKWNQANIERDLNVRGKYRSFGSGDFGDMSRSMSQWAGNYNKNILGQNSSYSTGTTATPTYLDNFKRSTQNINQSWQNPTLDYSYIGKKQKGGQINMDEQQQQMQQAFLQYLMEKTGAKNEQELEQVIQKLGEDSLKQAYQSFVQEMQQQQVQAAKFGAKLNYIKRLNGICPEGTELRYYKVGGRICKKCMQMERQGGKAEEADPINKFKSKKVNKDKNGCKVKGKWMPK